MAATSKIEWTDATWNPIRARVIASDGSVLKWGYHCEAVSPGCANCYAETMNLRGFPAWGTRLEYKPGYLQAPIPAKLCAEMGYETGARLEIYLDQKALTEPLHWKNPRRVFVCSMTDLFADFVQVNWIDQVFAVMALAPQHTFQVLTKRAERMREYFDVYDAVHDHNTADRIADKMAAITCAARGELQDRPWPLPNVWLGVSAEDQQRADERIPDLLATPAAIRFVSAEPLLGTVDLTPSLYIYTHEDYAVLETAAENDEPVLPWRDPDTTPPDDIATPRLDWVIAGGESGPKARPMHPDWVRALHDQCVEAGVPFFFKQWGEWVPEAVGFRSAWLIDHRHDWPDATMSVRVGKKRAGRVLDGRTWDQMPGQA